MWVQDEVITIAATSGGTKGSFGILGDTVGGNKIECKAWHSCRDYFQDSNREVKTFLFNIGEYGDGQLISSFIEKVESMLNVKTKTTMGPTNKSKSIWVKWSPFWRKYSMRRSLFSAFLRCSLDYVEKDNDNNFDEIIKKCKYFKGTQGALKYFLEGNTVFVGEGGAGANGWQVVFENQSDESISLLLRKPVKLAAP